MTMHHPFREHTETTTHTHPTVSEALSAVSAATRAHGPVAGLDVAIAHLQRAHVEVDRLRLAVDTHERRATNARRLSIALTIVIASAIAALLWHADTDTERERRNADTLTLLTTKLRVVQDELSDERAVSTAALHALGRCHRQPPPEAVLESCWNECLPLKEARDVAVCMESCVSSPFTFTARPPGQSPALDLGWSVEHSEFTDEAF